MFNFKLRRSNKWHWFFYVKNIKPRNENCLVINEGVYKSTHSSSNVLEQLILSTVWTQKSPFFLFLPIFSLHNKTFICLWIFVLCLKLIILCQTRLNHIFYFWRKLLLYIIVCCVGVPGVLPERLAEGLQARHCALSLVGEPIMYPQINTFVSLLHSKQISSFLVTNAQFPDAIR